MTNASPAHPAEGHPTTRPQLGLALLAALIFALLAVPACGPPAGPGAQRASGTDAEPGATIRGTRVALEVVRGRAEQAKGLGYRDGLAWGHGMLFVYPAPRAAAFWMKGMRFPIDIVWIRDGRIRQIHHRVRPPEPGTEDSALPIYRAAELIDHVLEVPAGFAQAHGWAQGDSVGLD